MNAADAVAKMSVVFNKKESQLTITVHAITSLYLYDGAVMAL